MKDILNKRNLRTLYNAFKQLPPFNEHRMPQGHKISIEFSETEEVYAEFYTEPMRLLISNKMNQDFSQLCETLLHEMVHILLYMANHKDYYDHGKKFDKYATKICNIYGYDIDKF